MSTNKIMVKAAGFMMITTLLARILGMARDMVLYMAGLDNLISQTHITPPFQFLI